MANRFLILLAITSFLILAVFTSQSFSSKSAAADDDDEYISFIEEEENSESEAHFHHGDGNHEEFDDHYDDGEEGGDGNFENYDDFDESEFNEGGEEAHAVADVDEKDVVVLKEGNFSDAIQKNRFVMGPESEELAGASRLEDDVNFYQTVNADVATLFHLDKDAKRPAVVMVKKDGEKLSHFDGNYSKSEIAEFAFANKLPLVTIFTRESASQIFESVIKKQLIFVYVESDNEDVGKPVSEYFGVTGDAPKVVAFTGNEDGNKFFLEGEVTLDNLKSDGFPTILFFPAGNKSFDPITFEGERTVVEFYKFLKKNAAIPFKLQRPTSSKKVEETTTTGAAEEEKTSSDLKDEL
ncbi:hypothetical protein QQ045_003257 [Rhodiola kirilowii]